MIQSVSPGETPIGITPESAFGRLVDASGAVSFDLHTPALLPATIVGNPDRLPIPAAFISDPRVIHPIGVADEREEDKTLGELLVSSFRLPPDAIYYPTTDPEYTIRPLYGLPDDSIRFRTPKLPDGQDYYNDEESLHALRIARIADYIRELEEYARTAEMSYEEYRDELLHKVAHDYYIPDDRLAATNGLRISWRGFVVIREATKDVLEAIATVVDGSFYHRSGDVFTASMIYDADVKEDHPVEGPYELKILSRTKGLDRVRFRKSVREMLVDMILAQSKREADQASMKLAEIRRLQSIATNTAIASHTEWQQPEMQDKPS